MSIFLRPGILQQQANLRKHYALSFDGVDDDVIFTNTLTGIGRFDIGVDLTNILPDVSNYMIGTLNGDYGFRYRDDETIQLYLGAISIHPYVAKTGINILSCRKKQNDYWDLYENDILTLSDIAFNNEMAINAISLYGDSENRFRGIINKLTIYDTLGNVTNDYNFSVGIGNILPDLVGNDDGQINGAQWIEL